MSNLAKLVSVALATSLTATLAACGGGTDTTGSGGEATTTTTTSTTSTTGSTSSTTTGTGGAAPATPSFVAHFDPAKGELPEGLFVTGSTAYVGYAALGAIVTVDLPGGTVKPFGNIPAPPMNGGFLLGIVTDTDGNVYVGFGGGPGQVVKNGVYKIPAAGGAVTDPWATDVEMNFPNGLAFDNQKNLFVADSGGAIFKIASDGTVQKWLSDPVLTAGSANCQYGAPFPIGANGIVLDNGVAYIANTNAALIASIPIQGDGSAGTPVVLAGPDCDALGGIDGIASDGAGGIYGVVNSRNRLVHLAAGASKVDVVFEGAPYDNPASLSVATVGGVKSAFVTNSAFFDMQAPMPGLVSYPLP